MQLLHSPDYLIWPDWKFHVAVVANVTSEMAKRTDEVENWQHLELPV